MATIPKNPVEIEEVECSENVKKTRRAAMEDDVETLMRCAGDLKSKFGGWTLLHTAAWCGSARAVRYLLKQGLDPEEKDLAGSSPIHLAARQGHLRVVEILLEAGANMDSAGASKRTALHLAVRRGHLPLVEYLLEKEADTRCLDKMGRTALDWADACGHQYISDRIRATLQAAERRLSRGQLTAV